MIPRDASVDDAAACAAIYAPYVVDTTITFETQAPTTEQMSERIATAKREMVARGAVVSTLPETERQRWIRGLPNLARTWAESSGPASREVLNAYFAAIRAAGQTPGRNWDRELTA